MSLTAKGILLLSAILAGAPEHADRALGTCEPLVEPSSEREFERAPVIDGKQFLCLGAGIRKRTFFRVYAVGFCVEEAPAKAELTRYLEGPGRKHAGKPPEELAEELRDDPEFFQFAMSMPVEKTAEFIFLRDISAQKLRDAFRWSLQRTLGDAELPRIEAFVSVLDRDIAEGDRMTLRTRPNGEVSVVLGETHAVVDPKLARAVWETYLGPESVTPALKDSVAQGTALLAARPDARAD